MIKLSRALCVLGTGAAAVALASSPANAISSIYSCNGVYGSSTGDYALYAECLYDNSANQSSGTITATAILKTASVQTAGLIGNRVSSALGNGTGAFNVSSNGFSASKGIAAGNGSMIGGVWASGSWSGVEDENLDTAYEGMVYTGLAGLDFNVSDNTIIGVAVGYEDVNIDTGYNGSSTADGNISGEGYTVAPYVGVNLGAGASANLTVGYSDLSYDLSRYDAVSDNRITGETDAQRYFVSAAAGGTHMFTDSVRLRGNASVFYAQEEQDDYTETEETGSDISQNGQDTNFGQAALNAKLGYNLGMVEPFALAGVEYDFDKEDVALASTQVESDDDFGARFGAGFDLHLGSSVTGGVEAYTVEFRDDYKEYNVTGGLRVNF